MIEERYHHCSFAYYELPGAPRAVAFHGILGMRLLHPFRPVSLQGVSSPGCAAQAVYSWVRQQHQPTVEDWIQEHVPGLVVAESPWRFLVYS